MFAENILDKTISKLQTYCNYREQQIIKKRNSSDSSNGTNSQNHTMADLERGLS